MESQNCVLPTVLVLTEDQSLQTIIKTSLTDRGLRIQASASYDDVDINYCLIIAGPDKCSDKIDQRLREIGGIPPGILLLRNDNDQKRPLRCCRCRTLFLPMDIFQLPHALDQLLAIHD